MQSAVVKARVGRGMGAMAILLFLAGCDGGGFVGALTDAGAAAPLLRVEAGQDVVLGSGESATLSANVQGGTRPYRIRWSQESGPESDIADATAAETTTAALNEQGTLVFRVVVADAGGQHHADFMRVEVGPPGTTGDDVVINGPTVIDSDAGILLTAVSGFSGDLDYAWEVVSGSGQLQGADTATPTLTSDRVGDVQVRVSVTDPVTGETRSGETTIHVPLRVDITAPMLLVAGMPGALTATVNADPNDVDFAWSVTQGMGSFDEHNAQNPMLTTSLPESLTITLEARLLTDPPDAAPITKTTTVISIEDSTPEVLLQTDMGDIRLELFADDAPRTVFNFLRYADEGFYDGLLFHRVVADFVIQGGGYTADGAELVRKPATHDPIASEADNGHSNVIGTVSMALTGTDADSAETQFFINLTDNSFLDTAAAGHPAFTIFAMVIEGMEVVDAIGMVPTEMRSDLADTPVTPVVITAVTRGGAAAPGDGDGGGRMDGGG